LEHLRTVLAKNDYPLKVINERIEIMKTRVEDGIKVTRPGDWFAFPFLGKCTHKIISILKNKLLLINFGYYTGIKLSALLSSHKDKNPKVNCGIYSIN